MAERFIHDLSIIKDANPQKYGDAADDLIESIENYSQVGMFPRDFALHGEFELRTDIYENPHFLYDTKNLFVVRAGENMPRDLSVTTARLLNEFVSKPNTILPLKQLEQVLLIPSPETLPKSNLVSVNLNRLRSIIGWHGEDYAKKSPLVTFGWNGVALLDENFYNNKEIVRGLKIQHKFSDFSNTAS